MTVYAETSAVLRWLFAEDRGEEIRAALARADKVTCSRLTILETRRVLRRAERNGRISGEDGAVILSLFMEAAATWAILEMTPDVARRAEDAFPVEPVRTLDAIHLASALLLGRALPELAIASTDRRVRDNAGPLGFSKGLIPS
ncbi:MAG: type II toxin-antitoxin system VapC family toxin [Candidatus Binatia bacterium]